MLRVHAVIIIVLIVIVFRVDSCWRCTVENNIEFMHAQLQLAPLNSIICHELTNLSQG